MIHNTDMSDRYPKSCPGCGQKNTHMSECPVPLRERITELEQQLFFKDQEIEGAQQILIHHERRANEAETKLTELVEALEKELPDLWKYYPNAARRIKQALAALEEE